MSEVFYYIYISKKLCRPGDTLVLSCFNIFLLLNCFIKIKNKKTEYNITYFPPKQPKSKLKQQNPKHHKTY